MKFLLGVVCGLVLGGAVYAGDWERKPWNQPPPPGQSMLPQMYLNPETGQTQLLQPLMPRTPC